MVDVVCNFLAFSTTTMMTTTTTTTTTGLMVAHAPLPPTALQDCAEAVTAAVPKGKVQAVQTATSMATVRLAPLATRSEATNAFQRPPEPAVTVRLTVSTTPLHMKTIVVRVHVPTQDMMGAGTAQRRKAKIGQITVVSNAFLPRRAAVLQSRPTATYVLHPRPAPLVSAKMAVALAQNANHPRAPAATAMAIAIRAPLDTR